MLYVTTRNNQEVYTANKALTESRAPDGGFYVPYRMPEFSREEIERLKHKSFGQSVSEILNLLFGSKLSAWDVDCTVGRSPIRVKPVTHRIIFGELWHNLDWDFRSTVLGLNRMLTDGKESEPSDWAMIGIRIAVLFGMFGKLMRRDLVSREEPLDIAVLSGDFSGAMAVWYARQWGLPIGNIILCCNDNNNPWELIYHGAIRTGTVAISTITPEGDYVIPKNLERFVAACGGDREVARFVEDCRLGRMYVPSDACMIQMRKDMCASVVGQNRIASAIPNVYRSYGCILEPYTALVYSGLMDYRTKTGEGRNAMVLSDRGPGSCLEWTGSFMGWTADELKAKLLK